MPSNARKEEMACWDHLHYTITKLNRINLPMDYDELVLQCVRKYPVGVKTVDNHIHRFYVKKGIIILNEEKRMIFPPDYDKRRREAEVKAAVDKEAQLLGVEPAA